ncbi:MAG: DUF2283 domain-containing protein [Dehalococcoidia bacterium]
MKISYDPEVDALYIRLVEGPREVTTHRLTEDVAINYASDGQIVGIEVLDASSSVFPTRDRTITVQNLTAVTSES